MTRSAIPLNPAASWSSSKEQNSAIRRDLSTHCIWIAVQVSKNEEQTNEPLELRTTPITNYANSCLQFFSCMKTVTIDAAPWISHKNDDKYQDGGIRWPWAAILRSLQKWPELFVSILQYKQRAVWCVPPDSSLNGTWYSSWNIWQRQSNKLLSHSRRNEEEIKFREGWLLFTLEYFSFLSATWSVMIEMFRTYSCTVCSVWMLHSTPHFRTGFWGQYLGLRGRK